jgi:hypothetical protein
MLMRARCALLVLVLAACAGHHAGTPAADRVAPPPAPVAACVARTDSLQIGLTDPADTALLVAMADTTTGPCGPDRTTFVVHTIDARTARDALDAGIDVLITKDPAAVAYAATRPDYIALPLPWDRLYVLVVPSDTGFWGEHLPPALAPDLVLALRTPARPAVAEPWRGRLSDDHCYFHAGPGDRPRIVYSEADSVARAIAERLVALADRPDAPVPAALTRAANGLRAVGLPAKVFAATIDTSRDVAYVLGLTQDDCPDGIPLVETRPLAIARRDLHLAVVSDFRVPPGRR